MIKRIKIEIRVIIIKEDHPYLRTDRNIVLISALNKIERKQETIMISVIQRMITEMIENETLEIIITIILIGLLVIAINLIQTEKIEIGTKPEINNGIQTEIVIYETIEIYGTEIVIYGTIEIYGIEIVIYVIHVTILDLNVKIRTEIIDLI
jgi:hypothetical protein